MEVILTERAKKMLAGEVATEHDMREAIGQIIEQKGSQKAVAEECEMSRQYLNDMLIGRCPPGGAVIERLGWERVYVYRKRAPVDCTENENCTKNEKGGQDE